MTQHVKHSNAHFVSITSSIIRRRPSRYLMQQQQLNAPSTYQASMPASRPQQATTSKNFTNERQNAMAYHHSLSQSFL